MPTIEKPVMIVNAACEYMVALHFKKYFRLVCLTVGLFLVVTVKAQTADFTFSTAGNAYCSPATVQFTPSATGTPVGYIWDFGNGTISSATNPTVTYASAGNYIVKLTIIYDDAAINVSKTVLINPTASVSISADRNYICRPGIVNFTATGNFTGGTYLWDFNDGTSTTTTTNAVSHNYGTFGNYRVVLTATNPNGCVAYAAVDISVKQPPLTATVSPQSGCIPATANFTATVNVPAGGSVTNYAWSFGDATTANTAGGNINHLYAATGGYNPSLTITTNEGCTNTYNFAGIAFGIPPTNPLAYLKKDTICGSETLVLVAKAGGANNYSWSFGDSATSNTSDTVTTHKYFTLGNKAISVTPTFNGCAGTTLNLNAYIKGVIAKFVATNSCTSKQTFTFTNTSLGNANTNTWNFGDGAIANNINTISHAYPAPGQYPARLVVNDSVAGCVDSFKQTIYYASPVLVSNDTLVCKGTPITINIVGNYANPSAIYTWLAAGDILGPTTASDVTNYKTLHLGLYYNYVVINNGPGYCTDTIRQTKPIRVRGLQMSYNASDDSICLNNTLLVTNTSSPYYPADTIRLYYWNFGDRLTNDTLSQPPPHKYANAGSYAVAVYGIDKNGCRDSLKKTITVNPVPFVRSIPAVDTLCAGQFKTLIAFHSDSIRWSPAALVNCIRCDTISVSPAATTSFIATAFNSFGCSNADTSIVKVYSPFTATTSFTDTAICLNDALRLMAMPAGKRVVWFPATYLSSATVYNPLAKPLQSTQYQVALTDSVGCFSDTATINVGIKSLPVVDAGPSAIYPYNSLFNFQPTYSANVNSYNWSPPNLLNCTNCPIPTGRNEYSQTYTVTVTSDSGCIAKDTVTILVDCKDAYLLMPTAFSPDNNGLNDYYYPSTRGVSIIKNFIVYNRLGQLVYQAKNFSPNDKRFGWDGRFKGEPQPNGAYVFMLEALCDAGQTLTRKGSFILLK